MTLILRQSTAVDIRVGPFLDPTDAVTPVTGITLAAADQAEVLKADGAATVAMGTTSPEPFVAVTGADGWYDYTVATGDVDTIGEVVFIVQDASACLPVFVRGQVVEAAVFDAMYALNADGPLQATTAGRTLDISATGEAVSNVTQWLGNAVTSVTSGIPDMNVVRINDGTNSAVVLGNWMDQGNFQAAESGTTTTLVDVALTEADDHWNGSLLVFVSGGNAGFTATVTDFDAASDTVTFTPAVPTGVTTEAYILVPGLGWGDFGIKGAPMPELPAATLPAITPTPQQFAMLMYMASRNRLDITASSKEIHNAAEAQVATKALTDDDTTYSEAEMVAGV